ncbi:MAG: hypothetical protein GKR95_19845 [Gammaproteobacteria bacterium]|nr:hypothetical protein [Gammaproteobacteria bacterium]
MIRLLPSRRNFSKDATPYVATDGSFVPVILDFDLRRKIEGALCSAYCEKENVLAYNMGDRKLELLRFDTQPQKVLEFPVDIDNNLHPLSVGCMIWHPTAPILAVACGPYFATYELKDGDLCFRFSQKLDSKITTLSSIPESALVACSLSDGTIIALNIDTGEKEREKRQPQYLPFWVKHVVWVNQKVALLLGSDGRLRVLSNSELILSGNINTFNWTTLTNAGRVKVGDDQRLYFLVLSDEGALHAGWLDASDQFQVVRGPQLVSGTVVPMNSQIRPDGIRLSDTRLGCYLPKEEGMILPPSDWHMVVMMPSGWSMYRVALGLFLGHNSDDTSKTRRVAENLTKFGVWTWVDESQLRPSETWAAQLTSVLHYVSGGIMCVFEHGWGPIQKEEALFLANRLASMGETPYGSDVWTFDIHDNKESNSEKDHFPLDRENIKLNFDSKQYPSGNYTIKENSNPDPDGFIQIRADLLHGSDDEIEEFIKRNMKL